MNSFISRLRTLTIAAAAGWFLAFSSTSSAAAFQVTFDPFTELYGTAIFNVQDACLATNNNYDTFWELLQLAASGCYITFGGASISTDGIGGPYTAYNTPIPFDLVVFFQLIIANNELAGITTLIPLEPVAAAASVAAFGLQSASFVSHCHEAILFTAAGDVTFFGCNNGQPVQLTGDVISIARVPEPGTLALLLGAGVAGWWIRRRRLNAA